MEFFKKKLLSGLVLFSIGLANASPAQTPKRADPVKKRRTKPTLRIVEETPESKPVPKIMDPDFEFKKFLFYYAYGRLQNFILDTLVNQYLDYEEKVSLTPLEEQVLQDIMDEVLRLRIKPHVLMHFDSDQSLFEKRRKPMPQTKMGLYGIFHSRGKASF